MVGCVLAFLPEHALSRCFFCYLRSAFWREQQTNAVVIFFLDERVGGQPLIDCENISLGLDKNSGTSAYEHVCICLLCVLAV